MKALVISIQPYWVFLIIAKIMGWNIQQRKTVEVRKNYPKAENWNKVAKIYCSKDKGSFSKIPKEYQPLMERFLGKVLGEFVCDRISPIAATTDGFVDIVDLDTSCLSVKELFEYSAGKFPLYGWHISDLMIYDTPKPLNAFVMANTQHYCHLQRPPQSWCYVEEMKDGK